MVVKFHASKLTIGRLKALAEYYDTSIAVAAEHAVIAAFNSYFDNGVKEFINKKCGLVFDASIFGEKFYGKNEITNITDQKRRKHEKG